jgi:hypothetical protein
MMSIRRLILFAVAALAMLAAGTQIAVAGKARTTVTITDAKPGSAPGTAKYKGKVEGKKGCEKNRKVTLIHNSDPPFTIGETTTDEDGKWEIKGNAPPASDTITVKVKSTKKCKGAKDTAIYEDLLDD